MDSGRYNFTLVIPPNFQRDVETGRKPDIQLNIDATIMSQAFIGATYIKTIALGEVNEYLTGTRDSAESPIKLTTRVRFNPNLIGVWFGGVMEVINNVTMLTIILVGAAFIREREHGTIEHLLVMPLTPFEIMMAKIWANGLAVLIGVTFALLVMVQQVLKVPIAGSLPLFLCGGRMLHVCGGLHRHFPRHAGPLDAAVRLARDSQHHSAVNAFRRRLAAREHAAASAEHHAGCANHLLRPPGAGHPLPGCRLRRDLARSAGHDRRRRLLLHGGAATLPQGGDADAGLNQTPFEASKRIVNLAGFLATAHSGHFRTGQAVWY